MKTYAVTCPDCKHDFPPKLAEKWGVNMEGDVVCDGCRERSWTAGLKRKANR